MSEGRFAGTVLGVGLALSCSRGPSLSVSGNVLPGGSPEKVWCALELRDRNDPRRSAGVIGVRTRERFSVSFTEGRDRIISDGSTPLTVVVSCVGFTPVLRHISRQPRGRGFDMGYVVVQAKQE